MRKPHKVIRFGKEFMTDGCTLVTFYEYENGELKLNDDGSPVLNECAYQACVTHDYHYEHHDITRKEADKKLYKELKECIGRWQAWLTYQAVKWFGGNRW